MTVYRETELMPWPVRCLLLALSLAMTGLTAFVLVSRPPGADWWVVALLVGVGVVLPLALMLLHSVVEVCPSRVRLGLWPWLFTFAPDDVVGTEVAEARALSEFGGLGLRWTGAGAWALIMRSGGVVDVRLRDGRRFVVGSRSPNRLETVLLTRRAI